VARLKVGVVLSGCGVYDGTEIHEAVITLLALDRAGAQAVCMAPNSDQLHVIDHLSGDVAEGEQRSVLAESARIARGAVQDMRTVATAELDALILPGGFGAAKNLCDFALKGADCSVHPDVARVVREVHASHKPIGAMCIAPALVAKLLGDERPQVTIGSDVQTAAAISATGSVHQNCSPSEIVIDDERLIVTTPAYMLAGSISEAAVGIEKLVAHVLKLAAVPS
jgi:enhancing lycopene biosynthesis protein 2